MLNLISLVANPNRPKSMGFTGSEEFIRLQFEEYLLALIASVRYKLFIEKQGSDPKALLADIGKAHIAFCHYTFSMLKNQHYFE